MPNLRFGSWRCAGRVLRWESSSAGSSQTAALGQGSRVFWSCSGPWIPSGKAFWKHFSSGVSRRVPGTRQVGLRLPWLSSHCCLCMGNVSRGCPEVEEWEETMPSTFQRRWRSWQLWGSWSHQLGCSAMALEFKGGSGWRGAASPAEPGLLAPVSPLPAEHLMQRRGVWCRVTSSALDSLGMSQRSTRCHCHRAGWK